MFSLYKRPFRSFMYSVWLLTTCGILPAACSPTTTLTPTPTPTPNLTRTPTPISTPRPTLTSTPTLTASQTLALKSAANLEVVYNSDGLARLIYRGVTLLDTVRHPEDDFVIEFVKLTSPNGTTRSVSGRTGFKKSMNLVNKEVIYSYSWGIVKCRYVLVGNRLNLILSISNTSSSETISGMAIYPMAIRFPKHPAGISGTTPRINFNLNGPTVIGNDYGTGLMVITNEDVVKSLYVGLMTTNETPTSKRYPMVVSPSLPPYSPTSWPNFSRPIKPGKSDRYNISLRFAPSKTSIVKVGRDIYKKFGKAWPYQVKWTDRRAIGALHMATSATGWKNNPRGWFNDSSINVKTKAGRAAFRSRVLNYADSSIAILKNINAQGMITWDIEGQEFPHATSYIGDPRRLAKLAPEMDDIANAYFKKFRDAGLRVGVCIRPQLLVLKSAKSAQQTEVKDRAKLLIDKISYAKKRWGATLFYIDSNGGPYDPINALIFKRVADAHPDVLLIPEHQNYKYYAYTMPYDQLRGDELVSAQDIRAMYPRSATVIDVSDGAIKKHRSQLVNGVRQGNILMFRAWFPDPANALVKSIYNEASK